MKLENMTSLLHLVITCYVIHVVMTTKTLYIGGLFDLGKKESWGVIPAAQLAVEEVNNSTLLPGYRLELLVNDTRNGNFKLASGVHNYLNNGPKKIILLGPVENDIAKSVAYYAALPQYRLLQFSYGTDDLTLANDRHLFPYFFRTRISLASLDDLSISFMKYFPHWTEVGIVHGSQLFDAQLSHQLKDDLHSNGIKVLAEVRLQQGDPGRAIKTIQDKDIHIIFGLFSVDIAARKLFCQAYKSGLYGPHYVWILHMASYNSWWVPRRGEDIGGCKEIEMTCQIQNYFNVKPTYMFDTGTDYTLSNKNTSHLLQEYYSRVDGNNTSNRTSNAWLIYDAVWSIAHVLKNSRVKLSKPLENVTYGDTEASKVFYNETLKLNFKSPTLNSVRYFRNGNRKFEMNIDQFVIKEGSSNPTPVVAGSYDFLSEKFKVGTINWRAGTPYRKTSNIYTTRFIHRTLFGVLIFLSCLGLLYAVICLTIVLVHRKQTVIWNSSPIINTIIILGCILNYITVILYAFDWSTTNLVTSLCRARAWTFAIGFTLSVGGLVAKLWIAYCVLTERFVRAWEDLLIRMISIVAVLFILDLIIMGCWEGIDPLYAKKVVYKDQEMYECFQPITAKTFNAHWYTVEHCRCDHPVLWLLIVLAVKFVLVGFGVFLSWQTRKLFIKSLNDTQHCGYCLYVVFSCGTVGVLCALLTTKLPDLFFGIVGSLLFLCTTIILALLHIHKMGRIVCKSRSRRGRTILVGNTDDPKTTKSTSCLCFTCSAVCCISMCSCFPCCNPYTFFRKCFYGTQVHPSKDDKKTEFYINGQAQEKDGQIAHLLRELRERDAELARLRPSNDRTSMWTQTSNDGVDDEDDGEYTEREDDLEGNSGNTSIDGYSNTNGRSRRKGRRRSSVKIFNKGTDYSHIRSKVDTGVSKTSPRPQRVHDEKYYLGVWQAKGGRSADADIAKLRAQLLEKDKEIEKLKKENGVPIPRTKITIINEETGDAKTEEKQCQTDDISYSPNEKSSVATAMKSLTLSTRTTPPKTNGSKTTKLSKNDPQDKIIVIKPKGERDVFQEEKPVQSSSELLLGKSPDDQLKPEGKEGLKNQSRSQSIVSAAEPGNIIVTLAENEEKKSKEQKNRINDDNGFSVIDDEKDTDMPKKFERQDNEDSEKLEKYEENEKPGRRKSIFSFFVKKDKDGNSEAQPTKGDSKSYPENPKLPNGIVVKPDIPNGDKPVKPESPQVEKQDQPVKPDQLEKDLQGSQVKVELSKNDQEKQQEKPDKIKHDIPVKLGNMEHTKDEIRTQEELDIEDNSPVRPPQNTPVSVSMLHDIDEAFDGNIKTTNKESTTDRNSLNKSDSGHESGEIEDDDQGDDEEEDNNNEQIDTKGKRKSKRRKKRVGVKLNWHAESKVDTSNSYKRQPSKKIKTFKADYSHVKSKLTDSHNNKNDNDSEKKNTRKKVKRKRWSPNEKS